MMHFFLSDDVQPEELEAIDIAEFEEDEDSPGFRLSCFLHSLQLCVRDGIKNTSFMSKALEKCRALNKFSHKSNKMADALDQLKKTISKATITRWNSDYLLVKSILSIGKCDLDVIVTHMENPVKFTTNEMNILNELLDVLEPFYDICIKCQSETVITASLVVPAVTHLLAHLREAKKNLSLCLKLVDELNLSLQKRFAGIVKRLNQSNVEKNDPFNDSVYFLSTVLDPSFKFFWLRDLNLSISNENRLKQSIVQMLIDEMNKNSKDSPTRLSDGNSSTTALTKKRKLFSYDDVHTNHGNQATTMSPIGEVNLYLNNPLRSQFSQYWCNSQLIRLKKLAKRVCSVQASSAPVERVFSSAGLLLSTRRTRMNEELFSDLVFLKVNQGLL